ncbi:MAG TPA: hypothetical protein VHO72_14810 [Bacteroidales bacterium]|nr:hypothetical protein [Bacteroidales bacterium]
MKKIILLVSMVCASHFLYAQQDSTKNAGDKNDTTRITFGNREINIIESEAGTDIKVRRKDEDFDKSNDHRFGNSDNWSSERKSWRHSGGFKGHLDAIEMGYNGFLNKDNETSLTGPDAFMSLNGSPLKSLNLNLNALQVSRNIAGNYFGIVTSLRLEFYNYVFDNNLSIRKDENGIIVPRLYTQELDKSKLVVSYFSIPLLFEFQFPAALTRKKRMWIAAGVIGSIKLGSHTKVKYREDGDRKKDKNHDDFNINVLRYSLTARMGYSNFYVYGNYSPVQFFEKNKGPELYPFAVGVGLHLD